MDDDLRDGFGVSVCAVEVGSRARIIFDDVDRVEGVVAKGWKHRFFYTSLELDWKVFDGGELTEREFAQIGRAVVDRLSVRMANRRRKGPVSP
jgi:hypothetical protein